MVPEGEKYSLKPPQLESEPSAPHCTPTVAGSIVHCDVKPLNGYDPSLPPPRGEMQNTWATSLRAGPCENRRPRQWTIVCLSLGIWFWETEQD